MDKPVQFVFCESWTKSKAQQSNALLAQECEILHWVFSIHQIGMNRHKWFLKLHISFYHPWMENWG